MASHSKLTSICHIFLAFIALASSWFAVPVFAQASKGLPILKLDSAIDEAKTKSPVLGAYYQETLIRKANIGSQSSLEDPSLSFEFSDYPASNFNLRQGPDAGNKITLRQKIPFPGKLSALKEAAAQEHIVSQNDLEQKKLELIASIKKLYAQLALSFATQNILERRHALIKGALELAQNSYSLGKAPQSDVLVLQVEEAELLEQKIQAVTAIEVTRTELNHLLGRSDNNPWRPEPPSNTRLGKELSTTINLASDSIANNPNIKSFASAKDAAKAKETLAKLNSFPDFELMADYTNHQSSILNNGEDTASIGFGITIPLWYGSKQAKLKEAASAERVKSELLLEEAKNSLGHEAEKIVSKLKENQARLAITRTALLPLTMAAIEAAQKSYAIGSTQISTVLNLIRSRFVAELSEQENLATQASLLADLEKLLGEQPFNNLVNQ